MVKKSQPCTYIHPTYSNIDFEDEDFNLMNQVFKLYYHTYLLKCNISKITKSLITRLHLALILTYLSFLYKTINLNCCFFYHSFYESGYKCGTRMYVANTTSVGYNRESSSSFFTRLLHLPKHWQFVSMKVHFVMEVYYN